jgi:hypothetical protein
MGMRRSQIAGERVQCVVTNESAGRHAPHAVFDVKFLNCGPSANRITVTENFRKVAVEQRLDTTHICSHGQRDAFLPACWFIRGPLVCAAMMRSRNSNG